MDLYGLVPTIIVAVAVAVLAFIIFTWVKNKKMPPTNEPVVGEYLIYVHTDAEVLPFEGTLYYFRNLLDPKHFHIFSKLT